MKTLLVLCLIALVAFAIRERRSPVVLHGTASYYAPSLEGQAMANGQRYRPDEYTCASWDYPLGARLRVVSAKGSVNVYVTDHGPAKRLRERGRILDLSMAAFLCLADQEDGVVAVAVTRQ